MGKKGALISIVLVGMLAGGYLSMVVVGEWADEHRYVYSSPLDYALDYLSDDPYSKLLIEVDWVRGYGPSRSALEFLVERIYEHTEKDSVRIEWNSSDEIPLMQATYSTEDLREIESEYRDLYKHDDTALLYIIYLNGAFADTEGMEATQTDVAGLEFGFSSIAIFKQEIREYSGSEYEAEYMERSVLLHEFGHTIALVGIGYDSPQEDPEHPHHSIYEGCVMYYAINSSAGLPPQDFCEASLQDIETIESHERKESTAIYVPWLLLLADILAGISLISATLSSGENRGNPPEIPDVDVQYFGDEELK